MRELKPDLAQGIAPGGPALTGADGQTPLWRRAPSQRTRDLAWSSLSTPLLSRLPDGADVVRVAQWPAGVRAAWQDWLAQADPSTLPETITELSHHADANEGRSLRLGRHAERLLHFALDHAPGIELLAANVPIRRANGHGVQTLGELDVVWRDPAVMETVHWEMAAKFYLMVDGIEDRWLDLRAFVGPNLVDRLGDKLDHIVRRQLPLGRTAEAKAALGHAIDRSEVYLLGWLFYREGVTPPGLDVLGIAPDHQRGWWSTLDAWMGRASERAGQGSGAARWCRLQRADWLSGARVPEAETESAEVLHAVLTERFTDAHPDHGWRRDAPVMVCELEPAGTDQPGIWVERSRGFVVPPGWEARAIERARRD
ncbi:hypothetical protein RN01_21895 [Cupriavidus sp. SHE]|uniref:DUF1853 family protein n=1 Tax=Cupriavidus metallidurans TaxID=119219 RepID=A0A482INC1_9BURK|nr:MULTISPECIES: DUF1853 family protein [Cupriavidus]KWR78911.1 hypothetical protein RN01_21895 [Cupriavidus sp. SHE]QBP09502.1 DUF1853 family protein [Cupriavidus metallidurans]